MKQGLRNIVNLAMVAERKTHANSNIQLLRKKKLNKNCRMSGNGTNKEMKVQKMKEDHQSTAAMAISAKTKIRANLSIQ